MGDVRCRNPANRSTALSRFEISLFLPINTSTEQENKAFQKNMKIMVVGDECTGKTDMLVQFCRGSVDSYSPSQFDSYNVPVTVDGVFIMLSIWDTAGSTMYDMMRPIAYPGTHVFVLCFSLYHEESFRNIREKWYPEVRKYSPNSPVILVGTDNIVGSEASNGKVTADEIDKLSKEIGAYKYIPVITLSSPDVVFSEAARAAFSYYSENESGDSTQCAIM